MTFRKFGEYYLSDDVEGIVRFAMLLIGLSALGLLTIIYLAVNPQVLWFLLLALSLIVMYSSRHS